MLFRILPLFTLLCLGGTALATELSGGLVKQDIQVAVKRLAWGSAHRPWTATYEENEQPLGLDLGIESALIPRGKLLRMGDGAGVLPSIIPVPRIWMGWDLPEDVDLSMDVGPGVIFDGITTYGASAQWTFFKEQAAASVVMSYTYANSFGDLKTHTIDACAQISKDLNLWQPYAGLGLMNSYGKLSSRRIAPGNKTGYYEVLGVHSYIGFMAHLPAKVGFQFDFVNTQPSASFLIAHEF